MYGVLFTSLASLGVCWLKRRAIGGIDSTEMHMSLKWSRSYGLISSSNSRDVLPREEAEGATLCSGEQEGVAWF